MGRPEGIEHEYLPSLHFRGGSLPTALLTRGNPYLAYLIARLLKEAGAKVVLLCDSGGIVRHSKFVDEWIDVRSLVGDTAT